MDEFVGGMGILLFAFSPSMAIATSRERKKNDKTTKNEDKKHARLQDIPSGSSSNPLSAMIADVVLYRDHRQRAPWSEQDAVGREEDEGCLATDESQWSQSHKKWREEELKYWVKKKKNSSKKKG